MTNVSCIQLLFPESRQTSKIGRPNVFLRNNIYIHIEHYLCETNKTMDNHIKEIGFKKSHPIEFEIKDLSYVKEFPQFFAGSRKATFYQLIWITEGEAVFHIDFRKITIHADEIFIISTNQVYEFDITSHYNGKMILFTDSFFNQTELDSHFLHTSELLNPIKLNRVLPINISLFQKIFSLLENELHQSHDLFQVSIIQSYLRVILLTLERVATASKSPLFLQGQITLGRRFYDQVEKDFKENKNTGYYINILGIGEKTLSKEVKHLTNKTPKAYIDSRIILEAKRLLTYSISSVKEIGFELGFDEASNFNKFFRKHTGITPLQFRQSDSK